MNVAFNTAQRIYHLLTPEKLRWTISGKLTKMKHADLTQRAINYLSASAIDEYKAIGIFLKKHGATMFPYDYTFKYRPENVQVHWDEEAKLHYVLIEDRKLYGKRGMLPSKIKSMINSLLIEQDPLSPHLYVDHHFTLEHNTVLYDVGTAEGIFTLLHIDKIKKAYLFEVEPDWIEALEKTFAPWKDKVEIINKFVGKSDDETHVSLDTFAQSHLMPDFIKADIEGAERDMLKGAAKMLNDNSRPLKAAVCTYHNQDDAEEINKTLVASGFQTAFTNGYSFDFFLPLEEPYLRKVLVRASK